ncbi:hypothetical protein MMC07_002852 [Pseudocyphellaria aurata]|nr:hypothetical protein [Pseudocyphellaria aurata]
MSFYISEKIDEEPFAYFISPADDRDVFLATGLAAGVGSNQRSRSLSPFHIKSTNMLSEHEASHSPVAKLKRWILKMEKYYFHRKSPSKETPSTQAVKAPATTSPPVRGRTDTRTSSQSRVTYDLRSPPRRPRAWREPSMDLWSVAEEEEDVGLGITAS